jgi:hypothetical protein
MKVSYTKNNIFRGAIIYSIGDTIASVLLGEFMLSRLVGLIFVGATVYALEIPNYFAWIEKKTQAQLGLKKTFTKTFLAIMYFNPLWIARHLFFIKLFSFDLQGITSELLTIAFWSFLVNIPISITANFIIQNKIKFRFRFIASAIFSGLMAIYYALSETLFN